MSAKFEDFIMQCCKSPEGELRKWLKKMLLRSGFTIQEDNYVSERSKHDKQYANVHNLLAIRSENGKVPAVCLVAHTDVCRDHNRGFSSGNWENDYGRHISDETKEQLAKKEKKVDPVIKRAEMTDGSIKRVIQDRNTETQVGGDDRLGVAINMWIALNSGYDMGILFTTDEEIGLQSAKECQFPELMKFELLCQTDRGNHSNELVYKISGEQLASYDMASRLLSIAYDIGLPRIPVTGMSTDVYAIKSKGRCKECINLTVGYHNSWSDDAREFIDIEEAQDTMRYVSEIIKNFYLEE